MLSSRSATCLTRPEFSSPTVVSSVSTAVIMTINQIEIFELIDKIKFEVKEGYSEIIVVEEDDVINKILLNLTFTLKNLELDYPKYIKIYENL